MALGDRDRVSRRRQGRAEDRYRPGVQAQEEWVEKVPIQKYIRYTAEELAAQEEARKKQEAKDKLPETVAALQAALADADALNLDQDYRLTLLELGVTDDETTA